MKQVLKATIVAAIVAVASTSACAGKIARDAIFPTPKQAGISRGFAMFVDDINARFDGEFEFNWRGGPEVMPPFGQAGAVGGRAMDIIFTGPSYDAGLGPASTTMNPSEQTYAEIRETKYCERMTELHAEKDVFFPGEVRATDLAFHIPRHAPFSSIAGLEGKRMRGAADWASQFKGVVFQAVSPGVYRAGFRPLLYKDAWNGLPENRKNRIIADVRDDLSPRIGETWATDVDEGVQKVMDAGLEVMELFAEGQKTLRTRALGAGRAATAKNADADADAEVAAELRAMLVY